MLCQACQRLRLVFLRRHGRYCIVMHSWMDPSCQCSSLSVSLRKACMILSKVLPSYVCARCMKGCIYVYTVTLVWSAACMHSAIRAQAGCHRWQRKWHLIT